MIDKESSAKDPQESALLSLMRTIALRDQKKTSRLLAKSPQLAQVAIKVGATRGGSEEYLLTDIPHHVYAGDTALHVAAATCQRDTAEELVMKGACVTAKNRRGAEPLHYAMDGTPGSPTWDPTAQASVIEFLIQAGADPNSEDKSGVAPLHRAVRTRCTAAVRVLLANGANVLKKNKSGSTPLHLAVQNTGRGGSGSTAAHDEQSEIIRLLLSHGARPADKDAKGKSVKECVKAEWIQDLLRKT